MGIARTKLGLKPELYDPSKAVSTGSRRVDILLGGDEKAEAKAEKTKEEPPKTPVKS